MSPKKKATTTDSDVLRPRWLRVAQAAAYLSLTKFAIRELAREGHIRFTQVGKRWLFDIADLDRFAERAAGGKF